MKGGAKVSDSAPLGSSRVAASSPEWRVLLECASPYRDPHRFRELLQHALDGPLLLALGDEHGVLALLSARLRECNDATVPPELRQQLQDWQRVQAVFSLSLTAELFRLLDQFAANGIETLAIKGPALSVRCYGDAGARQYSDLDLIARDSDILRCTEAMIALGYEPKIPLPAIQTGKFPGEYVFTRRDTKLLVEFHTERTFRYYPRPLRVDKLFERQVRVCFDGQSVPALSTEDELVLICIHGAKHFWERLMWIADVAALISRPDVDWDRAAEVAREVEAGRMLHVGLQVAADLLGTRLPAQIADQVHADSSAARLAGQIIRGLLQGNSAPGSLLERAAFRVKMRGGFWRGASYLLRLTLSPTEEDWVPGAEGKRPSLLDAAARPFRLARKHGRSGPV
jgi:uncharacterized protein (DUF2267 family)